MLNLVCYVWLYYNWFFVFDCIYAVLFGSLLHISRGLSAVKINELLLLGHVALWEERPIIIKLSRERSVGRSVCSSVCPSVQCIVDVSSAPPTARTAFPLRILPLDDTRTLKYNTFISVHTAHILQKYNTFATYPRPFMAARPLADVGPVPKLLCRLVVIIIVVVV